MRSSRTRRRARCRSEVVRAWLDPHTPMAKVAVTTTAIPPNAQNTEISGTAEPRYRSIMCRKSRSCRAAAREYQKPSSTMNG
ncbi:hypothetical protein GCM10020366_59250 [Saccharopolyspora gregorii]|uniref:Uncharacterized protein n=1 Tax=Saccharopolyspora gregorii TaxID=33914 RepID=A0ABP6RZR2_9PSEU